MDANNSNFYKLIDNYNTGAIPWRNFLDGVGQILKPGTIIQYYKRQIIPAKFRLTTMDYLYEIVGIARVSPIEVKPSLIIYKALYGEKKLWAEMILPFCTEVDKNKHPTIKQKYKFAIHDQEMILSEELMADTQEIVNNIIRNSVHEVKI